MNNLQVSLIQPDLYWLQPERNLEHLADLMKQIPAATDVVVLPEMFTSGFTDIPEPLYGDQQTTQWMCEQAKQHDVAVVGSIACEVESSEADAAPVYVNRLIFATPDGVLATYDKCHLFRFADEHKRYRAGNQRTVVEYKGWRLLLTICYDLRFPVFCRNQQDYDAMLCVANWPTARRHAWRTLLQARAIENQAYVVGVNRVGIDGKQLTYQGDSMAVDPLGELLVDGGCGNEKVLTTVLSYANLQHWRESFPVWKDADLFQLV